MCLPLPSPLQVCGGLALSLFRYDELELLVCGLPHLDFNELEKNARVGGGVRRGREPPYLGMSRGVYVDQRERLQQFLLPLQQELPLLLAQAPAHACALYYP